MLRRLKELEISSLDNSKQIEAIIGFLKNQDEIKDSLEEITRKISTLHANQLEMESKFQSMFAQSSLDQEVSVIKNDTLSELKTEVQHLRGKLSEVSQEKKASLKKPIKKVTKKN